MKRKLSVSLLVAVLIALLLVAVAFAAAKKWGILDFFKLYDQPIEPAMTAREMIASGLGSDENAKLRMTVREAVYDGTNVRAVVEVTPKDRTIMLNDFRLGGWDEAADKALGQEAASQGKKVYTPGTLFLMDTYSLPDEGQMISQLGYDYLKFFKNLASSDSSGCLCVKEGDSLVYSLTGAVEDQGDEPLRAIAALPVYGDKTLAVSFELARTGGKKVWKLTPEKPELPDAGCTILLAELRTTPLAAYVEITYRPRLRTVSGLDGQSTVYATGKGIYYHRQEDCSGMSHASPMTVNEAEAKGKKECPICLSGVRTQTNIGFELLDAQGNPIGFEDDWATLPDDEDARGQEEVFKIRGLLQPFEEAQAAYFLRPFDVQTGERFEAIRCGVEQQAQKESTQGNEW